ncbi:cysteine--tRNA ligase [Aliiroseovarius crassostreae]|uniref:Cysteine--tRNA ligase n=1 Tax=Aliiroseovarius crassostreae TaxID=154981 RepID=A0A9Q9HEN9_9RHOB|nr:cysteine--tRNA ligase [Aliiroseovarius crassostreae]UWP96764.1 cysteine--tRNA ligase [Aliiroseovarius crassostreae]
MTEIKIYNTKARAKQVFEPLDPENVRLYVCGPTVYDRAHLGNARPVVVFDVLQRLLRHVYGADHVTYVRNFTDVDDKINATALARKEAGAEGSLEELVHERSNETIDWYLKDMGALGAQEPDQMPRATEYIAPMIAMIEELIAKGHAYPDGAGHVLFSVKSYEDYGQLSGRSVDDMIAGARVEVADNKRDPMDFVLWKPSSDDLPGWDSPWGRGRPGWHIECSAMSLELLGASFDIHGGGNDLQFPHHENEIAQSKCAHPEGDFARYWMHNEMLQVEGKKMSKSLGNFFTVRDLLDQGVPGEVIRFVFLGTHYRKPMDWTEKKRGEAEKTLRRVAEFLALNPMQKAWVDLRYAKPPQEFVDALANDLNTPLALTMIRNYLKNCQEMDLVGSLRLLGFDEGSLKEHFSGFRVEAGDNGVSSGYSVQSFGDGQGAEIEVLVELQAHFTSVRQSAMESKDFSEVDALKAALLEAGVEVRMSKEGVTLLPGPNFDAAKLDGI